MKISKIDNLLIFFIINILLNASIACFRSKRSNYEEPSTVTPTNYANRSSINRTLVEIAATRTCNKTAEPTKEEVYCYHNGKCQSKLVPVNESHYERIIFCLCAKVKTLYFLTKNGALEHYPREPLENKNHGSHNGQAPKLFIDLKGLK